MSIVVQKFGGRLLESPEKIRCAARYILQTKTGGEDPVVVVSAPGRTTDRFIKLARQITRRPDERELDMLLSVGERMAMSLLAMAINAEDSFRAVSFTGSQVGIITDTRHTDATIIEVKGYRVREALACGQIPIIAGFQGISTDKEITTLGRGGSDATAVALAAALGAARCELIKECSGIFSADPLIIPDAAPLPVIDYATLDAIAAAGAKVVQPRAASLARDHKVQLVVRSLDQTPQTRVIDYCSAETPIAALTLVKNLCIIKNDDITIDILNGEWVVWFEQNNRHYIVGRFPARKQASSAEVICAVGWGEVVPGQFIRLVESTLDSAGFKRLAAVGVKNNVVFIVAGRKGVQALKIIYNAAIENGWLRKNAEVKTSARTTASICGN